jgi:hypothetical protein
LQTGANLDLSSKDTDDLSEGSTNLYFTTTRARASFTEGTGVTITAGEIAIGQAVATDSNVTFGNITGSAISGTTGTFTNDVTINNGSPELYFITGASHYSWMVAAQENVNQNFEITPSTVVGGTTFNAPAFKIDGSNSNATFVGQVTIPETPTADAHAASKKYVDDNIPTITTPALSAVLAAGNTSGANDIIMADDQKINFGDDSDFEIFKFGTGDNFIRSNTGHLYLQIEEDDHDMFFQGDDGSGGKTTYFFMDGSEKRTKFLQNLEVVNNNKLILGSNDESFLKWDTTATQLFISGESKFLNDLYVNGLSTLNGGIIMSNSILISYTGSDGLNRDAGIKIVNDSSDWGMLIDKSTNNFGLRISSDGANALSVYNSSNVNVINFTGSGSATFAGTVTAGRNLDLSSSDYTYLQGTHTGAGDGDYLMRTFGYGDSTFYGSFDILKHDTDDGELRLRQRIAGTATDVLSIVDGNSTFAGNVTLNSGSLNVTGATGINTVAKFESGSTSTNSFIQILPNGATDTNSGYIGYDTSNLLKFYTQNTLALYLNASQDAIFSANINIASASNSYKTNGYQLAKYSYFGYSTGYPGIVIGNTGGQSLFFNVDPVGNPSGSFNGGGMEYVYRNVGSFITPNASNNGYNTILGWNTSGGVTFSNGTTFNGDVTITGNLFLPTASSYIKLGGYSFIGEDLIDTDSLTIASHYTESIYFAHENAGVYTTTMRIDPSGKLGIGTGTSAIGQKLEVKVASGDGILINSADVATLKMKGSGSVNNWGLATTNLVAGDFGIYKSNAVGGDPISAGTPALYFLPRTNNMTQIGAGSSGADVDGRFDIRMNFLSQNWVPNNTSAKWSEVWCNAGTPGTYFNDVMLHLNTNRGGGATGGVVGIAFSPGWGGHQNWGIYSFNNTGSSYTSGDLAFVSQLNDGTRIERMRLDGPTGHVGIGSVSPQSRLHIAESDNGGNAEIILENSFTNTSGSTDETTQIQGRFGGWDGSYIITGKEGDYTTAALRKSYLSFSTRTATTGMSEKMRVQSDGIVYIHGQNNNYDGTLRVGERAYFQHRDAGQTTTSIISNYSSDSAVINFRMKGVTDANAQMTIKGNGNVGISINNPGYTFTVLKPITNDWLALFGNTYNGAGNGVLIDAGNGSSGEILRLRDKDGNHKVSFLSNGNVGIGINDPNYPIDVNGVIRSKPRTQAANVSGKLILASDLNSVTQIGGIIGTISFTSDDSDAGADFEVGKIEVVNVNQYGLRNDMTFTTRDQNTVSEKMRIQWDGKVGINTTSIKGKLDVYRAAGQSATAAIAITNGEGGGGRNWGISTEVVGAGDFAILQSTTNGGVPTPSAANTKLYISAAGYVGIGLTNPSSFGKLAVSQSYTSSLRTGYFQSSAYSSPHVTYDTFTVNQQDVPCLTIVETPAAATSTHQKLTITVGDANCVFRTSNVTGGMWFNVNGGISDAGYLTGSGTNAIRILNNADVGIGTPTPTEKLSIKGADQSVEEILRVRTGNGSYSNAGASLGVTGYEGEINVYDSANVKRIYLSSHYNCYINPKGAGLTAIGKTTASYTLDVDGTIRATSDVIAFSDKRVKENINTVDNALEKVSKLRGVTYTRKDIDDKSTKVGVIAQEVLEVLPEVVSQDDKGKYSVAYGNMAGVFIEAIKELKAEVDSLKQEIKELKK